MKMRLFGTWRFCKVDTAGASSFTLHWWLTARILPGTDQHMRSAFNFTVQLQSQSHKFGVPILLYPASKSFVFLRYCLLRSFAALSLEFSVHRQPRHARLSLQRFEKQREALRERQHITTLSFIAARDIDKQADRFLRAERPASSSQIPSNQSGDMASQVFVLDSRAHRATIKVTPGKYLTEVLEEACTKLGLNARNYGLKLVVN